MVEPSDSLGPRAGDVLGRYQLLVPVAKGGMGQVWVARLTGTRGFQKLVAVKTILPSNEDAANLESMLFDEASLASQIHHPNVAETLDLGEQAGTLYLVMEWVYGEPLDRVVRATRRTGGELPLTIATAIIVQACNGLHAAHSATDSRGEPLSIVHRDVSPQNLLVTYQGVVKLVDFGVAKATQQMSRPTTTGEVKGKFAYMAPEQVHGEKLDARADVFAMGIVLYWLTTGEHPFRAENAAATLRNIMGASPALPSTVVPGYPPALEAVTLKALAREKTLRYGTAQEMMLALEAAVPRTSRERSEHEVRAFMQQLFADRMGERTAALEAALQAADAGLAIASARPRPHLPASQSTMRAVEVEVGHGPAILLPSETPAPEVQAEPARSVRRPLARAAMALGTAALVALTVFRWRSRSTADSAAAAPALPAATAAAPALPATTAVVTAPLLGAGAPASAPLVAPASSDILLTPERPVDSAAPTGSSSRPAALPAKKRPAFKKEASGPAPALPGPLGLDTPPDPLNRRK